MKEQAASGTRDKLVAATFRVVARDGLEAASVKAIAAEAGVTPGLLHYHFATKDALIEEAMRSALADYMVRQQGSDLEDFFCSARVWAEQDREFFRLRLALQVRALNDPPTAALLTELNAAARDATAARLAGAGEVTEHHEVLAVALKAIFDGVMLSLMSDPTFPIGRVADFVEESSRAWLKTTS